MPNVEDQPHGGEQIDGADIVIMRFTVEPNYAGWRLDKYLCEKIRRLSRTRVQRVIERDLECDVRKLKASTQVWPGLTFTVRRKMLHEPEVPTMEEIKEVYLDDAILVLEKPAGLPVHPTARYQHGTLVAQLKVKYGPDFVAHPAHRLDRETSGLMVCGRTLAADQALGRAFVKGDVEKEYLAIVEGTPPDRFEVDAPIAEGTELIRIAVRIDREVGKEAKTRFVVEQRFVHADQPYALVRCFPETGRQHQIRIHAQVAGFALVGDKMYGPDPGYFDRFSKRTLEPEAWERLKLPRHALHAARLSFAHPTTRAPMVLDSALPADLRRFIEVGPSGVIATQATDDDPAADAAD